MSSIRCALISLLLLIASTLGAQQTPRQSGRDYSPRQLSFLVGTASDTWSLDWGLTVGPTFRARVNDRFAIGPIAEATFYGGVKTLVLLTGVFIVPNPRLTVVAAPGIEVVRGRGVEDRGHDIAFRVGLEYSLRGPGRLRLLPTVALEYGDRVTRLISGVSLGLPF